MRKNKLGLIGRNISYSFSRGYFAEKFEKENIADFEYVNFDIPEVSEVSKVFETPDLKGTNVTIPYKEEIIPFLDELNPIASQIGAVNTIKLVDGKKVGYNTDYIGFRDSISEIMHEHDKKALVLGTGGASKAIFHALDEMGISYTIVSRSSKENHLGYEDLKADIMKNHQIIINTTPVGTHPNIDECPDIPYEHITPNHLSYDLVYNPSETLFLKKSKARGARILNGHKMLILQAEAAWKIWND